MNAQFQFKFRTKYGIDILPYTSKRLLALVCAPLRAINVQFTISLFLPDSVVSTITLAALKTASNKFDEHLATVCVVVVVFFQFVTRFSCKGCVCFFFRRWQWRNSSQTLFDWTNNLLTSVSITVIDVEIIAFFQFKMIHVISRFFSSLPHSPLCVSILCKNQCKFQKIKLIQFLTCHIWLRIFTHARRWWHKKSFKWCFTLILTAKYGNLFKSKWTIVTICSHKKSN